MPALTVIPGRHDSARFDDVPEPAGGYGSLLVQTIAIAICGSDIGSVWGAYGWAPPGREHLVRGHESGRHGLKALAESPFQAVVTTIDSLDSPA